MRGLDKILCKLPPWREPPAGKHSFTLTPESPPDIAFKAFAGADSAADLIVS
jgi:hypothetical protein